MHFKRVLIIINILNIYEFKCKYYIFTNFNLNRYLHDFV